MSDKVVYGWYHNDEIFYIGIGTKRRSWVKASRNPLCCNKRAKAEREGTFKISILFSGLTNDQACQIEQELIAQFGRRDIGTGILTNMTDGGEGLTSYTPTEKSRKLMSLAQKGKPKSEQHRQNISKAMKGEGNHRSRSVVTPLGVFESCRQADKAHGVSNGTIRRRSENDNFSDFRFQ